jgi:hypothetical protein
MALLIRTLACTTAAIAMSVVIGQVESSGPDNLVRISGRLIDSTGAPIPDRTVTFRKAGPQDRQLKTDAQGVFSYFAERDVVYQVNLTVEELVFKGIGVIEVADGQNVTMGDIVLRFSPAHEPIVRFTGPIQITGETPSSVTTSTQTTRGTSITAVYITCGEIPNEFCAGGKVHIVLGDRTEVQPPVDKDELGGSWVSISEDKRSVGWLVDYGNCCTSYPLSRKLMIYRPGKPLRTFVGDGRAIFDWRFVSNGKQVAFYQDYPHGNPVPHYELRDVETGRLVSKWDSALTRTSPSWAQGLGTTPRF